MKRSRLFGMGIAWGLFILTVGGGSAAAQGAAVLLGDGEAPAVTKTQSREDALAEAVQDGDLPRLERLLAGAPYPESAARLAQTLAARPVPTMLCGVGLMPPRVPWNRERFVPVFRRLLRAVPDAELGNDGQGTALLMSAASLGDLESVRYLVERGANANGQISIVTVKAGYPEPTDVGGESPLLEAVRSNIDPDTPNPLPVVTYLLRHGANVNAADAKGITALIAASGKGDMGIVRALLAAGADPNLRTDTGWSALGWAQGARHTEVAALLAPLTDKDLYEASYANDVEAAQRLLDGGMTVDLPRVDSRDTPLLIAAKANAAETVELLLSRGASVNKGDWHSKSVLEAAARGGSAEVVGVLLDRSRKQAAPGAADTREVRGDDAVFPALLVAIESGKMSVVEQFWGHGIRIGSPDEANDVARALVIAADRTQPVELPDGSVWDVLSRSERNRLLAGIVGAGLVIEETPLAALAAMYASPDVLKWVLDKGASPNLRFVGTIAGDEWTPLQGAVQRVAVARSNRFHLEGVLGPEDVAAFVESEKEGKACFRLLWSRGARVSWFDGEGGATLLCAIEGGCVDMADRLLRDFTAVSGME